MLDCVRTTAFGWPFTPLMECEGSLVPQMVKNLLAMQEMQVQSLGQEDPL